jgi:hypothetical protein
MYVLVVNVADQDTDVDRSVEYAVGQLAENLGYDALPYRVTLRDGVGNILCDFDNVNAGPTSEDGQQEYLVTWQTQLSAPSPQDAAKLAALMQRAPSSTATVYEVTAASDGTHSTVDLAADHDPAEAGDPLMETL